MPQNPSQSQDACINGILFNCLPLSSNPVYFVFVFSSDVQTFQFFFYCFFLLFSYINAYKIVSRSSNVFYYTLYRINFLWNIWWKLKIYLRNRKIRWKLLEWMNIFGFFFSSKWKSTAGSMFGRWIRRKIWYFIYVYEEWIEKELLSFFFQFYVRTFFHFFFCCLFRNFFFSFSFVFIQKNMRSSTFSKFYVFFFTHNMNDQSSSLLNGYCFVFFFFYIFISSEQNL